MAGNLMSVSDVAARIFTPRQLDLHEASEMKFGRQISPSGTSGIVAAMAPDGTLAALLEDVDGRAKPFTVFVRNL
jgi:tRNA pseudouridine55 synthase